MKAQEQCSEKLFRRGFHLCSPTSTETKIQLSCAAPPCSPSHHWGQRVLNCHPGCGCSSCPRGGAGLILSSASRPLSPQESLNHGYQGESFHTKRRQTGGISTASSHLLQGEKNKMWGGESNKRSKGKAYNGIHVSFCQCENDCGDMSRFHSSGRRWGSFTLVGLLKAASFTQHGLAHEQATTWHLCLR